MMGIVSQESAAIHAARVMSLSEAPQISTISLSTTETELVGSMTGREELQIINDSSKFIYVGFTSTFTLDESYTIFSGQMLTIKFEEDFPIYCKLEEGTTTIKIVEVK